MHQVIEAIGTIVMLYLTIGLSMLFLAVTVAVFSKTNPLSNKQVTPREGAVAMLSVVVAWPVAFWMLWKEKHGKKQQKEAGKEN